VRKIQDACLYPDAGFGFSPLQTERASVIFLPFNSLGQIEGIGDMDNGRSIGFVCITKADEFFQQPERALKRKRSEREFLRPFGIGEEIRDWGVAPGDWVIFPYNDRVETVALQVLPSIARQAWRARTELGNRKVFGGANYFEANKPWYEYGSRRKGVQPVGPGDQAAGRGHGG